MAVHGCTTAIGVWQPRRLRRLRGADGPLHAGPGPDRANNVERIVIPQPEVGRYVIRVRAYNIPRGPQEFALVYSGGIR